MGPGNAGFLSGYHFVVPDPVDDEQNLYKRPRRVRIVFRPSAVDIRARKPDSFKTEYRLLFDNVFFDIRKLK